MDVKAILGSVVFTLKKCSPEILLGVGVVGVIGSTVLACTATLKAEEIIKEVEEKSSRIDDCVALRETSEVDYSVVEERKDRMILVFSTAGKFTRLYGPAATLMALSIFCIISSYGIMKKRNLALMAAYKLIEETFSEYRKRVVAALGEGNDARFLYGEEVVEGGENRKIVNADGSEEELVPVLNHLSGFSRAFEKEMPDQLGSWTGSTQWSPYQEYNLNFLTAKEQYFNAKLKVQGAVVINDVLSELGFPVTDAGMVCGWRYKSDRGDGYITFRPRGIDGNWTYGRDGDSIILDFNIDGVVFDQGIARKEMKS